MPSQQRFFAAATVVALVGIGAAAIAPPASAHHSYAMFEKRVVKMDGVVKAFEWTNPHIFVQVMAPDGKGQTVEWSLEGSGPGALAREGWKFNSLKPGDKISFGVAPLHDGRPGGGLVFVQKADGTRLNGGPLARLDPDYKPSAQ